MEVKKYKSYFLYYYWWGAIPTTVVILVAMSHTLYINGLKTVDFPYLFSFVWLIFMLNIIYSTYTQTLTLTKSKLSYTDNWGLKRSVKIDDISEIYISYSGYRPSVFVYDKVNDKEFGDLNLFMRTLPELKEFIQILQEVNPKIEDKIKWDNWFVKDLILNIPENNWLDKLRKILN